MLPGNDWLLISYRTSVEGLSLQVMDGLKGWDSPRCCNPRESFDIARNLPIGRYIYVDVLIKAILCKQKVFIASVN